MLPISPSPRQRLAMLSLLILSMQMLRDLLAYYDNWRSASRAFEDSFDNLSETLSTPTVSAEISYPHNPNK